MRSLLFFLLLLPFASKANICQQLELAFAATPRYNKKPPRELIAFDQLTKLKIQTAKAFSSRDQAELDAAALYVAQMPDAGDYKNQGLELRENLGRQSRALEVLGFSKSENLEIDKVLRRYESEQLSAQQTQLSARGLTASLALISRGEVPRSVLKLSEALRGNRGASILTHLIRAHSHKALNWVQKTPVAKLFDTLRDELSKGMGLDKFLADLISKPETRVEATKFVEDFGLQGPHINQALTRL